LAAGETKTVILHVPLRQLQYWSVASHDWAAPAGRRSIRIGASSRDLRLTQSFN
jgi:beta-glucosidase